MHAKDHTTLRSAAHLQHAWHTAPIEQQTSPARPTAQPWQIASQAADATINQLRQLHELAQSDQLPALSAFNRIHATLRQFNDAWQCGASLPRDHTLPSPTPDHTHVLPSDLMTAGWRFVSAALVLPPSVLKTALSTAGRQLIQQALAAPVGGTLCIS